MSRSCYSDDYGDEFAGQLGLYRGNVDRSIRSRDGQARLRELRDALLALPVKTLAADVFVSPDSDSGQANVCALGAWAVAKKDGDLEAASGLVSSEPDDDETAEALKPFRWPRLVVFDVIYENDRDEPIYYTVEGPRRYEYEYSHGPLMHGRNETPAERFARVLAWVEARIVQPEAKS